MGGLLDARNQRERLLLSVWKRREKRLLGFVGGGILRKMNSHIVRLTMEEKQKVPYSLA
jgi:hypothetical protein